MLGMVLNIMQCMGERERLFGSREREGKFKIYRFTGRKRELENATGRKEKFESCNPGNPGNHIKSKIQFNILFIYMPKQILL